MWELLQLWMMLFTCTQLHCIAVLSPVHMCAREVCRGTLADTAPERASVLLQTRRYYRTAAAEAGHLWMLLVLCAHGIHMQQPRYEQQASSLPLLLQADVAGHAAVEHPAALACRIGAPSAAELQSCVCLFQQPPGSACQCLRLLLRVRYVCLLASVLDAVHTSRVPRGTQTVCTLRGQERMQPRSSYELQPIVSCSTAAEPLIGCFCDGYHARSWQCISVCRVCSQS